MSLENRIRIVEFNVSGGFGPTDGKPRDVVSDVKKLIFSNPNDVKGQRDAFLYYSHELGKVIREVEPDIVMFSEMERELLGVNQYDIILLELSKIGLIHNRFVSGYKLSKNGIFKSSYDLGNVIVSRFPFTKIYNINDTRDSWYLGNVTGALNNGMMKVLTGYDWGRYLIKSQVEFDGFVLDLYCTHLDDRGDTGFRSEQVRKLVNYVEGMNNPVVLGGDLNLQYAAVGFTYGDDDTYDGKDIQILNKIIDHDGLPDGIDLIWKDDEVKWTPATYPDGVKLEIKPDRHLDYILPIKSDSEFKVEIVSYDSIRTGLSDHTMLVAEVMIR